MPSTYSNILLHVVFSTKKRARMIIEDVEPRLHAYLGGIVRVEKGVSYQIGGTADHVHLLIRWHTDGKIGDLLRTVKSRSSAWLHKEFPVMSPFAWQEGYGVFSVSKSQADKVERYILNQAKHHRKMTFQEELIGLLDAHGIEYDDRYLWD